ncbi:acetate--CoA ligase family protein [Mesorhizobium sp. 8]|uniref:acetate--CoA ligase family protein n=1 Tax=Mesorhizobium sp. 8 TaxID=2584466 RepID=UPI0011235FDC|nr:acetate--CoA ligase family protein [Mesorhizobium sp. 8]QDC02029.1 acetate--CoA ligase family protein [Mesorhizobium sp. 8]
MTPVRDLSRLLRPKSVAIIGGGAFGTNVVEQCLKMNYAGAIWPVHPSRAEVHGVPAFKSVADLPGAPDAAFVAVNRNLTIDIIRQLSAMGAGGAICFAAGFRETGSYDADGERLQADLIDAAGSMPIIGPNCYGLINYADGALLWPDQHGGRRLGAGERGVGIITQSSNIACNLTMQTRGLPVAFLMTAGNQAQTGLSEMALGLIEDDRVTALGLHIEGFDSVAGFERLAARARELNKPIVAMKVGRSEQARAATISHTASLAGSDAASDAFLRRLGIPRLDTIPSFLEALKLLHAVGSLESRTLSSMSCSGGEASVMADTAVGRSVHFPSLEAAHKARVQETLGPLVAVANPLDYNTYIWAKEEALAATFGAMASGGFGLNLLVLDFPRTDRCSDADWWITVNAFETALTENNAKGAIVASMGENLPEGHSAELLRRGIVPLHGIAEAFDAAEAAAFVGEAWKSSVVSPPPLKGEGKLPLPESPFPLRGGGMLSTTLPDTDSTAPCYPDEAAAKSMLAAAGLPIPPGLRAGSVAEAVSAAEKLGFPVALKALGVAHKSEAGAVRLDLKSADDVRAAAEALLPLGAGLYVERMVQGGVAELIVGFTRDAVFGPVMTLGSGGVLVELLKDGATLLLPASRTEIETALRGLKLFPLLDGYRGRAKADLAAATDAIAGIADFVVAHGDAVEELDVNPLIVCKQGEGAWIADALLVLSSPLEGEVAASGSGLWPRGQAARPEGVGGDSTPTSENGSAPHLAATTPPDRTSSGHPPLEGEGNAGALP